MNYTEIQFMNSLIINAIIYLLAAVIVVPLAKKFKLGSIVGYILAGILIGPFALGLISDQKEVHTFAEFGIIMMLFLIGLEIRPSELWSMRRKFLRYGASQIILTTLVIALVVYYFTEQLNLSIIAGLVLALSSTAIVIPSLSEMGQDANNTGRSALSVLLLQDVMVIPIIALIALFSPSSMEYQNGEVIQQFNNIERFVVITATVGMIIFVVRIIGYRFFHYIAKTNQREIFIASILLIVIAVSYIMQLIGLSPALGACLVGMLLSDNEYRHSIEVDIAPFKDILLGLFFITVGTSLNVMYALDHYTLALAAFVALLIIKGGILWGIAYQGDIEPQQRLFFAAALCQAGEFAFVLGGFAFQAQLFDYNFYTLVNVIATLSMISTPFLMRAFLRRQGNILNTFEELDPGEVAVSEIIIAGFGRFGQIVGRFLLSQGFKLTILEDDPDQVRLLRDFGYQVYYGRASDERILETIKANKAKYFIVAVDDHKASLEIIDLLNKKYPRLKVLVRAMDRRHVYDLMDRKVFSVQRETFLSSLAIGEDILTHMGVTKNSIKKKLKLFTDHDNSTLKMMKRQFDDNENYSLTFKQRQEDLKNLLSKEENQMKKKKNPKPKPKKTS
jgi:glutathione-regulated potassium-efflux system ancillary protein KefC